jgi:hypothetical protein
MVFGEYVRPLLPARTVWIEGFEPTVGEEAAAEAVVGEEGGGPYP